MVVTGWENKVVGIERENETYGWKMDPMKRVLYIIQVFLRCWTALIKDFKVFWEGYKQEDQGSPNGGNRLQVSDIFTSLKQQEETN